LEGIRWAGHRFHTQTPAAAVRAERVPGVKLNEGIAVIHPQLGAPPVWPVQPYRRSAGLVTGEVGESEIDALIAQRATRRKIKAATRHRFGPGGQLTVRVGNNPGARREAQHGLVN
jgi:hypothetical protein